VRIALIHKPLEKAKTFWSRELYTVIGVDVAKSEWDATTYVIGDGRKFTRDRLQKVDMASLVKIDKEVAPQPPKCKTKIVEPPTARAQPQRERAPSSKLAHHYMDY
jgi:hypothetical protein